MKPKLLIVDDDLDILKMLQNSFAGEEMDVTIETDSTMALQWIVSDRPNVAIFDINMPRKSGLDLLLEAKKVDSALAIIITSGQKTTQNAIEAMKRGAYDYMTKPLDLKKLKNNVQKALECNLLNRKVRFTRDRELLTDEHLDEDIRSAPRRR